MVELGIAIPSKAFPTLLYDVLIHVLNSRISPFVNVSIHDDSVSSKLSREHATLLLALFVGRLAAFEVGFFIAAPAEMLGFLF